MSSDRYYYDRRRLKTRGSGGRSRVFHFLFPFLLLIIIGVVAVLGFRLLVSFYGGAGGDGVFVYIVDGQAQIKLWGTSDFSKTYNGTRILQGDELYTNKDSRAVVEFFDDTVLRVSGETHVVFNDVYNDGEGVDVQLVLNSGEIWVNKTALKAYDTDFLVLVNNILITPVSDAVFSVGKENGVETVRVVYGEVNVDVYSQNGGTVVDHITIDAGQMALFDFEKLQRFWKFQAPNVVENLSGEFVESSWYTWNILEDEEPTEFSLEEEVVSEAEEVVPEEVAPEAEEPVVVPEDVAPASEEVVVVPEEVVLDLGPLGVPEIMEVNSVVWDDSLVEEGLKVDIEPVQVIGKVQGAYKVVINGYELQRFEPKEGEESFVYWVKEEYENLSPGENIYEVYALDRDGARSSSVYFKIIYEPVVEEELEEEVESEPELEVEPEPEESL